MFSEGLAVVFIGKTDNSGNPKEGKYGYINSKGKEKISLIYDDAEDFKLGMAKVKLNGKGFIINRQGKQIKKQ